MSLSAKEVYDLNNMNVAAQNVKLGTLLNNLLAGGGGTMSWINLDELNDNQRERLVALLTTFQKENESEGE